MKLYRNISTEEMMELTMNGQIEPKFNTENKDSSYNKEMGAVTCWFAEPITMITSYDFLIEVEIDEAKIIGEGMAEYSMDDPEPFVFHTSTRREIYTKGYKLRDVKSVKFLNGFDFAFSLLLKPLYEILNPESSVFGKEEALASLPYLSELQENEWKFELLVVDEDVELAKSMAAFLQENTDMQKLPTADYMPVVSY